MYGLYQIMYFTLIDIFNTLLSPFFILIFFIIFYQYYKLGKSEYSLSINKFSALNMTVNSTIYGIFGGFISTILFIYLEVAIIPKDFMYILTIAILLSLIDQRFMCFAYGGSIVSLLSIFLGYPKIDTRDIMLVVATFHLVESLLISFNGFKGHSSAYFEHKGEYVGGYNINRFWPIPFVIFIGDSLIKPITMMAIIAYGDFTVSYPRRKTIHTSVILFCYSLLLLFIIKNAKEPYVSPIFALLGHEFIVQINGIVEKNKVPIFTTSNRGVRVIDVYKKGIAKELGIIAGDIIISINEVIVYSEKDLLEIEELTNRIIRVNYFNKKEGIITKTYKGNKKTLGISIVPRVLY